ncbi:MAG: class I SAM-dependent methyltransferase [Verrucomicrobiales bacterium]|nr:class I SAM-dependent methyltransferase [Verrucomicrobiales bacterium]
MKSIIQLVVRLFNLLPTAVLMRNHCRSFFLKHANAEQIFTRIYQARSWPSDNSLSGPGSEISQTKGIIESLPEVIRNYEISTMLDIPCGDFYWMKEADLGQVDYLGADIVADLIARNDQKYRGSNIRFRKYDLLSDKLPRVDLILCRDCLVHFSESDVFAALTNIYESQSEFLLTTTFPKQLENGEIRTGDWRAINLEMAPFQLTAPVIIINEGCTEVDGTYKDKSLGLWRITDLKRSLKTSVRKT